MSRPAYIMPVVASSSVSRMPSVASACLHLSRTVSTRSLRRARQRIATISGTSSRRMGTMFLPMLYRICESKLVMTFPPMLT